MPHLAPGKHQAIGKVDLNLLIALEALLTEQNVTRAAQRTWVGQPAMSSSLARLRKYFDDPLLVRRGRDFVLTPHAEELVDPVKKALAAVQVAFGNKRAFDPSIDHRTFEVIASDYTDLEVLRHVLGMSVLSPYHPALSVSSFSTDATDALRRGEADLLVCPIELATDLRGYPQEVLFNDRFVLVTDQDNDDVQDPVDSKRFSELPFLAVAGPLGSPVNAYFGPHSVERNVQLTTQDPITAPFMLMGTRLVALLRERTSRSLSDIARLRVVRTSVPLPATTIAMFWNPDRTGDVSHIWLRAQVREAAKSSQACWAHT